MPYVNEAAPPGLKLGAAPRHAAIGELTPAATVDRVADDLVAAGVPADHIHFLTGQAGLDVLDHLGNWLSRFLSEDREQAVAGLSSGKTYVGVFDLDHSDAARIRRLLHEIGVDHTRYFGTWTFE